MTREESNSPNGSDGTPADGQPQAKPATIVVLGGNQAYAQPSALTLPPEVSLESLGRTTAELSSHPNLLRPTHNLDIFKINFIHSLITSSELVDSGVITNPYSRYCDPSSGDMDLRLVKVYFHLPPQGYLAAENSKIPVVAICDAGVQEINRIDDARHAFFQTEVYPYPPRKLIGNKLGDFIDAMGIVLGGTFVLAIALSDILVGRGLKRDDHRLSYSTLMNVLLLPLVVTHARNNFRKFDLCRESFVNDRENDDFIEKHVKGIMTKTQFSRSNSFTYNIINPGSRDYFYIYSSKVIAYAIHKAYNESNDGLLLMLSRAFA